MVRCIWTQKQTQAGPRASKVLIPMSVTASVFHPYVYIFAGPTAQRRARSRGLRSVLRTTFFQFTKTVDVSLGRPPGGKHPWIVPMLLVAAWERP